MLMVSKIVDFKKPDKKGKGKKGKPKKGGKPVATPPTAPKPGPGSRASTAKGMVTGSATAPST